MTPRGTEWIPAPAGAYTRRRRYQRPDNREWRLLSVKSSEAPGNREVKLKKETFRAYYSAGEKGAIPCGGFCFSWTLCPATTSDEAYGAAPCTVFRFFIEPGFGYRGIVHAGSSGRWQRMAHLFRCLPYAQFSVTAPLDGCRKSDIFLIS